MAGTLLAFTVEEACQILDPPMTEQQLAGLIAILGRQPDGKRFTGRRGRPRPTYDARWLIGLHGALVPFMSAPLPQVTDIS